MNFNADPINSDATAHAEQSATGFDMSCTWQRQSAFQIQGHYWPWFQCSYFNDDAQFGEEIWPHGTDKRRDELFECMQQQSDHSATVRMTVEAAIARPNHDSALLAFVRARQTFS
jgi:hypothetical protein